MNIDEIREYCLSFKGTAEKLPFDETTLVFTVQNKMFCLTDLVETESINVKCDPEEAVALRERYEEVLPGYHMNKNHWNTVIITGKIPNALVKEWIKNSYDLVVASLPKKLQKELME